MISRRPPLSLLWIFLVLGLVGSVVLGNARPLNEAKGRAMLDEIVAGEAARPFVLRRLVPAVIGGIEKAVPDGIEAKLSQAVVAFDENQFAIQPIQRTMHPEELAENGHLYLYAMVVHGIFLGVFAYFLVAALSVLYDVGASGAFWFGLSALAAFPLFSPFVSHFSYDTGTLMLFAMGLYGSASGDRKWFWVSLVLAPWNRITAVLLVVIDLVLNWGYEKRGVQLGLAGVQLAYCGLVSFLISSMYAENRGANVAYKWSDNGSYLMTPSEPTWLPFLGVVAFLVWLHVAAWKTLPDTLKRLIPWIYAPVLILHVLFGVVREIRAVSELYPFIWLVAAGLVFRYFEALDKAETAT